MSKQRPITTDSSSDSSARVKKSRKWVGRLLLLLLLAPLLGMVYLSLNQPRENQIFFDMNRPEDGQPFDILFADVEDSMLQMTVTYEGGCGDHFFDAYVEDQQSDINRRIEILHSTDETCDTRVTEDLRFDVAQTIDEHDSEQVIFTIIGNGQNPDPFIYKKDLPQDDSL